MSGNLLTALKNTFMRILMVYIIFNFYACSDTNQTRFDEAYDKCFTLGLDIETFSKKTGINYDDLIRMRFGLKEVNSKITDLMVEISDAITEYNYEKVEKILNKKSKINLSSETKSISKDELIQKYRIIVFSRNQKFDSELPIYISDWIKHDVENYIDHKFAWYRFPINGWDYIWSGKEKLQNRYQSDLLEKISTKFINDNAVKRFNFYGNLLSLEQETLFNFQLNLPSLQKIQLESIETVADKNVIKKLIERNSIDLTDTLLTLIEEVGIALIIWFIFRVLINRVVYWYGNNVLDLELGRGFWGKALIVGLNLFNSWAQDEEIRRLMRIKRWIQWIVTIGFIVCTYFYVIKPQIKIENEIITTIDSNITEYISNLDIPILEYFNNIIDKIN